MTYINRNANVVLLLLILVTATILVGATVYYQEHFTKLNQDYDEKVDKLEETRLDLLKQASILNKTQEELSLKAEREEEFTEKYTDLRDAKSELESSTDRLEGQKETLQAQVEDLQKKFNAKKAELEFEIRRNAQLDKEKDLLEVQLQTRERQIDQLVSDNTQLQTDLDACQGS